MSIFHTIDVALDGEDNGDDDDDDSGATVINLHDEPERKSSWWPFSLWYANILSHGKLIDEEMIREMFFLLGSFIINKYTGSVPRKKERARITHAPWISMQAQWVHLTPRAPYICTHPHRGGTCQHHWILVSEIPLVSSPLHLGIWGRRRTRGRSCSTPVIIALRHILLAMHDMDSIPWLEALEILWWTGKSRILWEGYELLLFSCKHYLSDSNFKIG